MRLRRLHVGTRIAGEMQPLRAGFHHHYAFRQGTLDYQVWITTGAAPLPRKVVIINRGDEARPQSVSVITWALKAAVQDSVFSFKPPQGAKKVEIAQRKAK